jgi:hypothetical protein
MCSLSPLGDSAKSQRIKKHSVPVFFETFVGENIFLQFPNLKKKFKFLKLKIF